MTLVRSHTRRRPYRSNIIDGCLNLCADLREEREWRALEAVEYALPGLERDIAEIVERDVFDDPQFDDLTRDDRDRMREVM